MQNQLATILNKHGIELTSMPSIEGQTLPILLLAAAAEIEDRDTGTELVCEASRLLPKGSPVAHLIRSVWDYLDTNDPNADVVKYVSRNMHKYLPEAKFTFGLGLELNPDLWIEIAGETIPVFVSKMEVLHEARDHALTTMKLHGCTSCVMIANGQACELPEEIRYINLYSADFEPDGYSWFRQHDLANV